MGLSFFIIICRLYMILNLGILMIVYMLILMVFFILLESI